MGESAPEPANAVPTPREPSPVEKLHLLWESAVDMEDFEYAEQLQDQLAALPDHQ